MLEVLFQTFSPIIGHMLNTKHFLYEVEFSYFIMLPICYKIWWKNTFRIRLTIKEYNTQFFRTKLWHFVSLIPVIFFTILRAIKYCYCWFIYGNFPCCFATIGVWFLNVSRKLFIFANYKEFGKCVRFSTSI